MVVQVWVVWLLSELQASQILSALAQGCVLLVKLIAHVAFCLAVVWYADPRICFNIPSDAVA